jgi:hypothetical protein
MPRTRKLKICFDCVLEGEQLRQAMELAFNERFENPPILPSALLMDEPPPPVQLALFTRTMWKPGRELHVRFLGGADAIQNKVETIAHMWEEFANLKLIFDDSPNAEIRVAFTPGIGSWSYLGTDALTIAPDKPTMNYGWLTPTTSMTEYHRVVLHEFGHALGCIHEHQNPSVNIPWNKEAVYRAYGGPPNNWSRQQVDVNLFKKYSADQTQFSEFDKQSIMLYPVQKELTDGVYEVGWNAALSAVDQQFIAAMYPKQPKAGVELKVGGEAVQTDLGVAGEEDLYWFTVPAPGQYTIETSGRTDVMMGLFGPNDAQLQIALDDDSGPGLNARIQRALQPGEYNLRVRHYRPKGTGKYGVSIKAG